jgi:predicted transcriptional regulator
MSGRRDSGRLELEHYGLKREHCADLFGDRSLDCRQTIRRRVNSWDTVEAMETVPVKPDRLAQLEDLARRRGKSTADALDDVLADYLEWERQDYQDAVEGIRQGYEDVKAGRTVPVDQFLDEFARKHGLPR